MAMNQTVVTKVETTTQMTSVDSTTQSNTYQDQMTSNVLLYMNFGIDSD